MVTRRAMRLNPPTSRAISHIVSARASIERPISDNVLVLEKGITGKDELRIQESLT
uniref:Uncharacterized protein n=1 Tax=Globisporangium ultimum (strain ATCC 200006 / CBS 805.95 / DAOM BR144) TaxID=431595 RepID=K3W8N1_GLOUD